ncbi:MAG: lytic transglycosylase domain-containing protein [Clostridia bacterium]|nr:lytic transglycosylase domain-containing protein [Clostridia bacterium]
MKLSKICLIFAICVILVFIILKIFINCVYPNKYSEYVEKYSKEYDVDSNLVYAIIKQESNFDPDVNSPKGAVGLMQLMRKTAEEVAERMNCNDVDLCNPEINIKLGVKHLSDLLHKYENNEKMAVIAYNAGMGNVDNWIDKGIIDGEGTNLENVPYKETNMYLRKVLKNYEIYCKLY